MSDHSQEDDPWETCLRPHFHRVVGQLQVGLVLDRLLSARLVSREEYNYLRRNFAIDEDRARHLLTEVLPKKGPEYYKMFCEILLLVPGQEHIVGIMNGHLTRQIIGAEPLPAQEPRRSKRLSGRSSPKASARPPKASTQPRGKKRKRNAPPTTDSADTERPTRSSSESENKAAWKDFPKRATCFFKDKHRPLVNTHLGQLRALFWGSSGVPADGFTVYYDIDPEYEKDLTEESCVLEAEDKKLVSIVLHGVSATEVEEKHPEVIDSIAAFVDVRRGQIQLKTVQGGCAVMILDMEV